MARHTDDAMVSAFYASLVGAGLTTLAMPFVWQPMPVAHWMWFALMGCCGLVGHWLLAVARIALRHPCSPPIELHRTCLAALFDLFVFGEIPDQWTLAGSAIILTAGALLWRAAPKSIGVPAAALECGALTARHASCRDEYRRQ